MTGKKWYGVLSLNQKPSSYIHSLNQYAPSVPTACSSGLALRRFTAIPDFGYSSPRVISSLGGWADQVASF